MISSKYLSVSPPPASLRQRARTALLVAALFGAPVWADGMPASPGVPAPAHAPDDGYDALMLRARAGDTEPALQYLRRLGASARTSLRFDHILVASWAGLPEEVVAVYERLPLAAEAPPAAVLQAVARAFRELKRWPEALTLWRTGLLQYPQEQAAFVAGFVLTLVDAGQGEDAVKTGLDWVKRAPKNSELRMALVYAYATLGRAADALQHADRALQLAPNDSWVQHEYVLALARAGLSEQALARAKRSPHHFMPAQIRALEADVAALKTRLAVLPTRTESERYVIAERALAQYDRLIADWRGQGADAAEDLARIRVDRLAALHARARMADLVAEYEALVAEGVSVPARARSHAASAYLALRQPERAHELYRTVLAELDLVGVPEVAASADAQSPADTDVESQVAGAPPSDLAERKLETETGLFYALVADEQFAAAAPVLERIKNYGPAWRDVNGTPAPNPHYLDAQVTVARASLLSGDTPAAQAQLETLVEAAPGNPVLRTQLAEVYQRREQPRRAEEELKLAEALEPRRREVEVAQGLVALDLQEWRQVEDLSADTLARFPENPQAQRLARLWAIHNRRELRLSVRKGFASNHPVAGDGVLAFDTTVYSSPLAYNWRGFAGVGHAQGKFREGSGHSTWQRGGVEWRRRDWWAEGEVFNQHYGHGAKPGARLAATFDVNDAWQLGAGVAWRTLDAPLRALRSDIDADSLQASLRWHASERREWRLALTTTRFSDGNDRSLVTLAGRERLATYPHFKLDLLFDAAAEHNNHDARRPYYNPSRDLLVLPGLRATQILRRYYDTVWEHSVTLAAGVYNQSGYGSSGVVGLTYGQRWRYNDALDLGASLAALRRSYDGKRENELQFLFDLKSRF